MATIAEKEAKKITKKQAEILWANHKSWKDTSQSLFKNYGIQNTKGNMPWYNLASDIMEIKLGKKPQIQNTKKAAATITKPSRKKPKSKTTSKNDELNQIEVIIALGKNGKSAQEIIDMGHGIF